MGTKHKCKATSNDMSPGLKIAGDDIALSQSVKNFGVTFDQSLSFDDHISSVCVSVNFRLRTLAHICKFLSIPSANLIASSVIASGLDYCNDVFAGLTLHNLQRLQRLQNRATRIVLGFGNRVSAEPLLRQLHWLPIVKRINYKIALHSHSRSLQLCTLMNLPTYLNYFILIIH